jgi:hypothetical protein
MEVLKKGHSLYRRGWDVCLARCSVLSLLEVEPRVSSTLDRCRDAGFHREIRAAWYRASRFLSGSRHEPQPRNVAMDVNVTTQTLRRLLQQKDVHAACRLFQENMPMLSVVASRNPMMVADAYDFALQAYAIQGDATKAERLVSNMWKQKIPVGRVANSSVVKALCAAGRRRDALKYLKSISSQRSDIVGYNILLNDCAGEKEHHVRDIGILAWDVMKRKIEKGAKMKPDAITWSAYLRLHGCPGKDLKSAWEEWVSVRESFDEADRASVGASYVSALCARYEFDMALNQCEELFEDIQHHLPLLLEIPDGQAGSHHRNEAGVDRKHASAVENVRVACNTLLHACVATSNDAIMDKVIKRMTARGLTPDTITYNALLRRSVRRREGSVAVQEGLAEMQRIGLLPDQTSIEILIQSHALQGQITEAENAVDVIIREYAASPCHAWGTLMAACGHAGDVEHVAHVFKRATTYIDENHPGEGEVYENIIEHCLEALYDALGKDFWRRILHKGHLSQGEADIIHHQSLPEDQFSYMEEVGLALLEDVEAFLQDKGIHNTKSIWMSTMKCFSALGKFNDVKSCLKDMRISVPQFENHDAAAHGGVEQFMNILETPVQRHGKLPDPYMDGFLYPLNRQDYSDILHVMARLGALDSCFSLVEIMRKQGMKVTSTDYISLIEACAQCSPPMEELSRKLLNHARMHGIPINTRMYNAFLLVRLFSNHIHKNIIMCITTPLCCRSKPVYLVFKVFMTVWMI